jgi:hypothetical protein
MIDPRPEDRVRRFFGVALPHRVVERLHLLFSYEGRIAFSIKDAGSWTLRFASDEPVTPRFDRRAELQLHITREAFEAWLDGSLDVPAAVKSGAFKARGQLALLEAFGRLLSEDANGIGWEAGP